MNHKYQLKSKKNIKNIKNIKKKLRNTKKLKKMGGNPPNKSNNLNNINNGYVEITANSEKKTNSQVINNGQGYLLVGTNTEENKAIKKAVNLTNKAEIEKKARIALALSKKKGKTVNTLMEYQIQPKSVIFNVGDKKSQFITERNNVKYKLIEGKFPFKDKYIFNQYIFQNINDKSNKIKGKLVFFDEDCSKSLYQLGKKCRFMIEVI